MKRVLGKSGIEVSALGLGCWAIGGTWAAADGKTPQGWGELDDNESINAIRTAIECGINLLDSSNVYGCGHSEEVIGKALVGIRDKVVLATKFGYDFDEETKLPGGAGSSPEFIRKSLEGSLKRLKTDYIDLFQFHDWGFPAAEAEGVIETLETLVKEGKIRAYGWSTDMLDSIKAFNRGEHNTTAQLQFNVFEGNPVLLDYCEKENLAVLCRSPLAMGLLSSKYDRNSKLSGADIRTTNTDWLNWFKDGKPSEEYLKRRDAIQEILQSNGRSLVQGALAWLWGKSDNLIPIPGFKKTSQVIENAKAMEFGPLTKDQVEEVEKLVSFTPLFC